MEQKRVKSALPIYLAGLAFIVYALFLPLWRFTDLLLALAVALVVYFLLDKLIKGKIVEVPVAFEKSGDSAADRVLAQGRAHMLRLQELVAVINDETISQKIRRLLDTSSQIFGFISKNPDHARRVNTFVDYYYPQALKFLESYVEFSGKAVKGENVRATLDKISNGLVNIEEAFKHQLDNLYSDKAMDIKADLAVLENIMKREGVS